MSYHVMSGAAPPVPGAAGDGGRQCRGWGVEDPEDGQQGAGAIPHRGRPGRYSQDVLPDQASFLLFVDVFVDS